MGQIFGDSKQLVPVVVVIGMVATGILNGPTELKSSRPVELEQADFALSGDQRIPARLWQDPIVTVRRAWERLGEDVQKKDVFGPPAFPDGAAAADSVLILPVMLPRVGYPEDAEQRIRIRHAVMSGLSHSGFAPNHSRYLGCFSGGDSGQNKTLAVRGMNASHALLGSAPGPWLRRLVPFEWFGRTKAHSVTQEGHDHGEEFDRVLALWIDESWLGDQPLNSLRQLVNALTPSGSDTDVRIIGPTSSSMLIAMASAHGNAKPNVPKSQFVEDWEIYSPFASVRTTRIVADAGVSAPESATVRRPDGKIFGVNFSRVTAPDHVVVAELVREIQRRSGDLANRNVVIISEWDTAYGRDIRETFDLAVKDTLGAGVKRTGKTHWFSYLRGLNGVTSGQDRGNRQASDQPSGASQLDVLRRIVGEVEKLENVAAVGVLGSDEFDKLLGAAGDPAEPPWDTVFHHRSRRAVFTSQSIRVVAEPPGGILIRASPSG